MKRLSTLILLLIFLACSLAACATTTPGISTPVVTPSNRAPSPPSPTIENTSTLVPSKSVADTPFPTLTLSPTSRSGSIDTATPDTAATLTVIAYPLTPTIMASPTFDINSIRTSTPAPAAVCPSSQPKQVPTLYYMEGGIISVPDSVFLDFLNQFGVDAFRATDPNHTILYRDLTNDGVPEVVVSFGSLYIFGCKDGRYRTLLATDKNAHGIPQIILSVTDLNRNGIPEILIRLDVGTQADSYYRLFEWGDGKFNSLFSSKDIYRNGKEIDDIWVLANGTFSFRDVDGDGMQEIVLYNGYTLTADYYGSAPFRRMTKYYKWNGQTFTLAKKFFDPPEYRFQAVEDADYAVLAQQYDQALALYQRVIFDDRLEAWTYARLEYNLRATESWWHKSQPTPGNTPAPDPTEYLYLSAYARFRIMVLHLLRGYESDAQVVYQTLQKKYPEGTPGSIYARMAQAFWRDYQTSHSVNAACGPARAVAIEKEEEATHYLIDDYPYESYPKGQYRFDQLCPFR